MKQLACEVFGCEKEAAIFNADALEFRCELHRNVEDTVFELGSNEGAFIALSQLANVRSYVERFKNGLEEF